MLPIYALHGNDRLWPDPHRFDPDRFADAKQIDRFAYLPFGDGPRICIGASFAIHEAVIILATLLARFRFTAVPGRDPKPVLILTLRPEGGVRLEVTEARSAEVARPSGQIRGPDRHHTSDIKDDTPSPSQMLR